MLKADFKKYTLVFRNPAATSRGVYSQRDSWFVFLYDTERPEIRGVGECAPLPGLSPELDSRFEEKLSLCCRDIRHIDERLREGLKGLSSIQMGMETACRDLFTAGGAKRFVENDFTAGRRGILINGLVWMGPLDFMRRQHRDKIREGYGCVKIKIGALDFQTELAWLREIRRQYPPDILEIRLDANGAFTLAEAKKNLHDLSDLAIHSMEQPLMAGQGKDMAALIRESPVPIALDEELIGVESFEEKEALLHRLQPSYLVLKPSLHGGFRGCREWIDLAERQNTGWWITSALESNIGLNAIAQWTSSLDNPRPQGLGTGRLFTNNFPSPLYIQGEELRYKNDGRFDLSLLEQEM
jgi:o-succinylbenzoate synthase